MIMLRLGEKPCRIVMIETPLPAWSLGYRQAMRRPRTGGVMLLRLFCDEDVAGVLVWALDGG
jgi:hypothetical protein